VFFNAVGQHLRSLTVWFAILKRSDWRLLRAAIVGLPLVVLALAWGIALQPLQFPVRFTDLLPDDRGVWPSLTQAYTMTFAFESYRKNNRYRLPSLARRAGQTGFTTPRIDDGRSMSAALYQKAVKGRRA